MVRHPDISAMLGRALNGQTPERIEFSPLRDPNRTVVARAAPIATEGARGAVLVLHDITDLRQADRMRRDFVANVSHELRTPLTAIQGYVEALQDDVPPEPDEAARFLEIIARQANRMERLVRDLLRLARLEAGHEPVEPSRTDLETLFADVVTELEGALEDKGQRVVTDIGPSAGTLVVDTAKLHDALRNLVENAIAYAPPSTIITLAARRSEGECVLTVADEGPGIPEADLTRIFERFYRVDKARSRESGGTGLGLSIVKHLVGILGGEVKAANRPAGGAVFTVRLPAP
jgi:two-component system phosphate regulon sensor histidine kinase PhoR